MHNHQREVQHLQGNTAELRHALKAAASKHQAGCSWACLWTTFLELLPATDVLMTTGHMVCTLWHKQRPSVLRPCGSIKIWMQCAGIVVQ